MVNNEQELEEQLNKVIQQDARIKNLFQLEPTTPISKQSFSTAMGNFIKNYTNELTIKEAKKSELYRKINDLRMMQKKDLPKHVGQEIRNLVNQRLEEIMNRPNFKHHNIGTERKKLEKDLEQARVILFEEIEQEIIPIEKEYNKQKEDLKNFEHEFENSLMHVSSQIDIDKFSFQQPDDLNTLKILNQARANSREKFQIVPKKKLNLNFQENQGHFQAKQPFFNVNKIKLTRLDDKLISSENSKNSIEFYQQNFSSEKHNEVKRKLTDAQNSIYASVAAKYGLSPQEFNATTRVNDETSNYESAYKEVDMQINQSNELRESNEFDANKEKAYQKCILSIHTDLVPSIIKLKQLNELAPNNEKLSTTAINSLINAIYEKALKDRGLETSSKNKAEFSSEISDQYNIQAYSLSANEIERIKNSPQEFSSLMQSLGVSEEQIALIPKEKINSTNSQTKNSPVITTSDNLTFSSNAMQTQENVLSEKELKAKNTSFINAQLVLKNAKKPKNEKEKIEIQNSVCKLIEAYPDVIAHYDRPKEDAFIKVNNLNKMLQFLNPNQLKSSLTTDIIKIIDERLEEIIRRPDFDREKDGTARYQREKNLEVARKILKEEIEKEAQVATLDYENKKRIADQINHEFHDSLMQAASKIDLESFKLPSLVNYSIKQKDLIYPAIDQSRENFPKKKEVNPQVNKTSNSSTKDITSETARKSLDLKEPSAEFTNLLATYRSFTPQKITVLEQKSLDAFESIIKQVSQEMQDNPDVKGFNPEIFTFENYKAELLQEEPYNKAFEKVFSDHARAPETIEYLNYLKSREEAKMNVFDQLKAEFTEKAVRIHQLNDSLPDDLKMSKKDLNTYITTAYSETLEKEKLYKDTNEMVHDKGVLIKEFTHPVNIKKYSAQELTNNQKKIQEMQNLLESMGIKGNVVIKKEPELPIPKTSIGAKFENLPIPTRPKGPTLGRGA